MSIKKEGIVSVDVSKSDLTYHDMDLEGIPLLIEIQGNESSGARRGSPGLRLLT